MFSRLRAMLPEEELGRRLVVQSLLFSVGDGTFFAGNAVYFTQIVGLTPTQVGLALSLSSLVSLVLTMPLSKLVDRFGTKPMWVVGAAAQGALYLCYPLIHGFVAFAALLCVYSVFGAIGRAGRGAYVLDALPAEGSVNTQAYMRASLNLGFTIGALISGAALATNSDRVLGMIPLFTGAVLLVNAWWIAQLPAAAHALNTEEKQRLDRGAALKNRAVVGLAALLGLLGTHQVVLGVVIPLWLVDQTDAPRWVLAWLFGTNTVMAVVLQVAAARGSGTLSGALRAIRLGTASFVLTCGIVALTETTVGWVSILLLWLGHVSLTAAELWISAAEWGLVARLSDPARRGEYQGVFSLGFQVVDVVAPAAFTWLTLQWVGPGWFVIALLVIGATVLVHPLTAAAQRYLEASVPTRVE